MTTNGCRERRCGSWAALIVVAVLAPGAVAAGNAKAERQSPAATLFHDGFDRRALDRAKWTVRAGGAVNNDEQQRYVDTASTLYVSHGAEAAGANGGVLVIREGEEETPPARFGAR